MRILVGKVFGLGNAVLTVPLLKALKSIYGVVDVDVLVGSTHDDVGAYQVFRRLQEHRTIVSNIFVDRSKDERYDIAIMAIPFDGRFKNGIHFNAERVLDGRSRPDPEDQRWGFHTWKKHEIEYMMEPAYALGYRGDIPDCSFSNRGSFSKNKRIYFGMGYKKMPNDPWKIKHWGNVNYAALIRKILDKFPDCEIYTSCNAMDLATTVAPVHRMVNDPRFKFDVCSLETSFDKMSSCWMFVGNDTGMMHVAASFNLPVVSFFFMQGAEKKNPPWCSKKKVLTAPSARDLSVDDAFDAVVSMMGDSL